MKPKTWRQEKKEQRHRDLLEAAGRLFGTRGFAAVTLDDIGAEVGVSGQAIYRHFTGKQALLAALLIQVSDRLLQGGHQLRDKHLDSRSRIEHLIGFHVEFAIASPEIIRVQEQEMGQLQQADRDTVRRMQREYIDVWSEAAGELHPSDSAAELRTRIHGIFGLINSTARSLKPHSSPSGAAQRRSVHNGAKSAPTLQAMAWAAMASQVGSPPEPGFTPQG